MSNIVIYDPNAIVVNQITQYLISVNTPDYDSTVYKIINPDMSAVSGQPMKYWKVSGTSVVLMSGAKLLVDFSTGAQLSSITKY